MKRRTLSIICSCFAFLFFMSIISAYLLGVNYGGGYFLEIEDEQAMRVSSQNFNENQEILHILEIYQDEPVLRIELTSNNENAIELSTEVNDFENNNQLTQKLVAEKIIIFSIIGAVLIILCITTIIVCKRLKIVLQKSERLKQLLELNKTFNFKRVQSRYSNQQSCSSKRQLENLSLDDYLMGLIVSNESFYKNIVESFCLIEEAIIST